MAVPMPRSGQTMGTGETGGASSQRNAAAGMEISEMEMSPLRERSFSFGASATQATTEAKSAEITMEICGEVNATTAVAGTSAAKSTMAVHNTRTRGSSSTNSR